MGGLAVAYGAARLPPCAPARLLLRACPPVPRAPRPTRFAARGRATACARRLPRLAGSVLWAGPAPLRTGAGSAGGPARRLLSLPSCRRPCPAPPANVAAAALRRVAVGGVRPALRALAGRPYSSGRRPPRGPSPAWVPPPPLPWGSSAARAAGRPLSAGPAVPPPRPAPPSRFSPHFGARAGRPPCPAAGVAPRGRLPSCPLPFRLCPLPLRGRGRRVVVGVSCRVQCTVIGPRTTTTAHFKFAPNSLLTPHKVTF